MAFVKSIIVMLLIFYGVHSMYVNGIVTLGQIAYFGGAIFVGILRYILYH